MSYTALYRKFRPAGFEGVKGQQHIVTTLKNQIKADRMGHAYLFCGTRGTGKTSVAKIFAKAVNCENPLDGSPCNECEACKSIENGSSMNVIEIDAASNNGVDSIRQIRDEVQYSPTEGRYKVYIIDEVHMLSIGAFNALLKTLEEPPAYAIFILATTEVHKIPITILSRCQRYDFKRITVDIITKRLQELIDIENVNVEPKAVRYIAKLADGALRDAISLLDQSLAFYMGQQVSYENVLEVLGAVDTEVLSRMLHMIIDKDITGCIGIIEEVVMLGRELNQFVLDFTWYLRNLLLIQSSNDIDGVVDVTAERLESMKEESLLLSDSQLMRYIRILSELTNQIKFSSSKRVLVEIAIIKMIKPSMENDVSSLLGRIEELEDKVEKGIVIKHSGVAMSADTMVKEPLAEKKQLQEAIPEDVQYIVDHWHKVQSKIKAPLSKYIEKARFSVEGEKTLLMVYDDSMIFELVHTEDVKQTIETIIGDETGKDIIVACRLLEQGQEFEDNYAKISSKINFKIEEEEF